MDKEFLTSLDSWRTLIAIDICKNNKALDEDEINYVVQQTIDRLIFLRIAEDRSIEPYGSLKDCVKNGEFYNNLFRLFQRADDKYNSGLYDFKKDRISQKLVIDNKVVKRVINELYYPESPYEFSVISVEILGNAYEQFLGKQIKIDQAHRPRIDEKPAVRKAGGVFYTPQYIVDYIIQKTIGAALNGKTAKDAEKLKIVDPACGSGSFLLGAYQYLLNWHKGLYINGLKMSKGTKNSPLTPEGNLTTNEKKRILINNIFGVDIDSNAVEVTKLSLLLKCMEGETEASIASQLKLFHERVLPTLENNIKNGNSLIDVNFYSGELDFGNERKVRPFSWERSFPEVFRQKGFDFVIGNPPYVLVTNDIFAEEEILYLNKYAVAQYKVDLFHLFIERGLSLLKPNGALGYILPSTWMTQQFTDKLRKFVLSNSSISEIFHFDFKVFDQADVYTEILLLHKGKPNDKHEINFMKADRENFKDPNKFREKQAYFSSIADSSIDIRSLTPEGKLAMKIVRENRPLDQLARASLGCQAYNSSKHTASQIKNRVFHSDTRLSDEYLEELAGTDVSRYFIDRKKGQWIKYGPWLHDYRTMDWLTGPRILIREITGKAPYKIQAAYTEQTYCNYKTILNVSPTAETKFSMKYLCGILNSKLMSFLFSYTSNKIEADSFPRISVGDVKKLPIKDIDLRDKVQKKLHDQISHNVDVIAKLMTELESVRLQSRVDSIRLRISICEDEIDRDVLTLYGVSAAEVSF